jgi:F-box only protein C-terminal region
VSRVARSLQPRAGPSALAATSSSSSTGGVRPAAPVKQQGEQQHVFAGRYVIKGGDAYAAVVYPNSRSTELRLRLHIRGLPCLAAANRLDIKQLVTFDRDDGSSADMLADDDQGVWTAWSSSSAACDGALLADVLPLLPPLPPCSATRPPEQAHMCTRTPPLTTLPTCAYTHMPADLDDLPSAAGRLTNFQRGTSACVFVPWHEVATSPLNLAAREMDFFVTG